MTAAFEKAKVSIDRGETDKAHAELLTALDEDFGDTEAAFCLGGILIDRGHPGIASILLKYAIEGRAKQGRGFPEAWRNLGGAFKATNQHAKAEDMWKIGIEVAQQLPEPSRTQELAVLYASIAGASTSEGDPKKVLEWSAKALQLAPNCAPFLYNQSLAELELCHWADGWQHYELGFQTDDRRDRRYGSLPVWDGTPDQTVIVWGEQGIGDEILFASCLPDMIKRCKKVIMDCHPRLITLFQRSFPEIEFHPTRKIQSKVAWLDGSGAQASICAASLMTLFRKNNADFPGAPFLKPGRIERPAARRPRIGISWYGGTFKTRQDLRSIPLDLWKPVLQSIDADWYSLQYGDDAARHVCAFEEDTGIRVKHYAGWVNCPDYDRTASFTASMDLVITVTTALYHLAGALGVPTLTLVPSKPTWQFGAAQGARSIFYHSCELLRQAAYEPDWKPVMATVAKTLQAKFA